MEFGPQHIVYQLPAPVKQPTWSAREERRAKKILPPGEILFEHFVKIVEISPLRIRKR
jgi:hypothetical protein